MFPRLRALWRNLFHRGRVERDLDDELRSAYALLVDEHLRAGISPAEAHRRAGLAFGGIEPVKERVREARAGRVVESVAQDLRFAARLLTRDRWFAAAAIGALALALGVTTTVLTVANAVLLRGVPLKDPGRVVAIESADAGGRPLRVSRLDAEDWRAQARTLSGLALCNFVQANLADDGLVSQRITGAAVSANFFTVITQHPQLGRDFQATDERAGAPLVIILSDAEWKSRYGGDPGAIGRTVRVNAYVWTIVGVMPPDVRFPYNNDFWMLASQLPPAYSASTRGVRVFDALGRLAPDVTMAQARTELTTIGARLAASYPATNQNIRPTLRPYAATVTAPALRLLTFSLLGAVAFVLLIACANVASLLLSRASGRSREVVLRLSLGATRARIVRQLLIESLLLATISGVLGYALSIIGVRFVDAIWTVDLGRPYWMQFTLDRTVFAVEAIICVATGILFGLAPALHLSRTDIQSALKEAGGRSHTGGAAARRWTHALMVLELALTLVLLAGAGFMIRSFLAVARMDEGVDTAHVLTLQVGLPVLKYPPPVQIALYRRLEERLASVPAIQSSALSTNPPLFGGEIRQLTVDERPAPDPARSSGVTVVGIGTRYFETLGIPIHRGRAFTARDGTAGYESAIVNERFASLHFAGDDPLGHRITLGDTAPDPLRSPPLSATIVGVVPTIRQNSVRSEDPDPVVYIPYQADPRRFMFLMVRAPGDAASIAATVRNEMHAIEPDIPLFGMLTLDDLLAQPRWSYRVFGSMFTVFAVIALVLAMIGLYSVTAYAVTQRTAEIGVRMALGARRSDVLWLVMRRTLIEMAIGLPIGIAGAYGVGAALQSVLVQPATRDALTIGTTVVLLVVITLVACVGPAWRAMRLDPVVALREP